MLPVAINYWYSLKEKITAKCRSNGMQFQGIIWSKLLFRKEFLLRHSSRHCSRIKDIVLDDASLLQEGTSASFDECELCGNWNNNKNRNLTLVDGCIGCLCVSRHQVWFESIVWENEEEFVELFEDYGAGSYSKALGKEKLIKEEEGVMQPIRFHLMWSKSKGNGNGNACFC